MSQTYTLLGYVPFLLALALLIVTGCGDGSSSSSVMESPQPLTVQFNVQAKGLVVALNATQPADPMSQAVIEWDFGDGQSAIGRQPVHVFSQAGTFTITANYTGPEGRASSRQEVSVVPLNSCDSEIDWKAMFLANYTNWSVTATGDPGLVAFNETGSVFFSENGFDWCDIPIAYRYGNYRDLEWSGDRFWALKNPTSPFISPQTSFLMTSLDGKYWQELPGPPASVMEFSAQANRLLVITGGFTSENPPGQALHFRNADGNWQKVFDPPERLVDIFWTGERYLLFGFSGDNPLPSVYTHLWTSSDGLNWTAQIVETPGSFNVFGRGNQLLRHGNGLETSTDGITWTSVDQSFPEPVTSIHWGNDHFLALSHRFAYYSDNGSDWSIHQLPQPKQARRGVATWTGLIWIVNVDESLNFWSRDGRNWHTQPVNQADLKKVFWQKGVVTDTSFLVGGRGQINEAYSGSIILETTNGSDFELSTINDSLNLFDLTNTPHGVMASGSTGSSDAPSGGIFLQQSNTWQRVLTLDSDVRHLATNGRLVLAATALGELWLSSDGRSWQQVTTIENISVIRAYDNRFVILTNDHQLHHSENGLTWEVSNLPFQAGQPMDIAYKDGLWVMVSSFLTNGDSTGWRSFNLKDWQFFNLPYSTEYRFLTATDVGFYLAGSIYPHGSGPFNQDNLQHVPVVFSEDGFNWQPEPVPHLKRIGSVSAGPLGALIVSEKNVFFRDERNQ